MRYILLDEDGIPLRRFWSMDAAEKFLQDGYTIKVLPKPKRVRTTLTTAQLIEECGEAPF